MDYTNAVALTRIRLSNHWFPIERDRCTRPLMPRENRICTLCSDDNGDELHCMLLCSKFNYVRKKCLKYSKTFLLNLTRFFKKLEILLPYLLQGHDQILLPYIIPWCHICNIAFKES